MNSNNIKSDAEWYFRDDPATELYYDIFFKYCRKYNVSWDTASKKEKAFIEEATRVSFEREMARREGKPIESVKGFFAA